MTATNDPLYLKAGTIVRVIDSDHPMFGWVGVVTSPAMWFRPMYKKIPYGSHRIKMEGDSGVFYGDYRREQLEVVKHA